MRTDNRCIAVLVAFALRSESPFSLRHPSFEAEGIPLVLSPGGTFKSHQARIEAGVSLLTCECCAACSNCQTCHMNLFLSPYNDEMAGPHQKKRWVRAWGFLLLQRALPWSKMEQEVKDHRAAQWNTWLDRDCPVNKGCRIDASSGHHPLTTVVEVSLICWTESHLFTISGG